MQYLCHNKSKIFVCFFFRISNKSLLEKKEISTKGENTKFFQQLRH
jgi:hypothetical protein